MSKKALIAQLKGTTNQFKVVFPDLTKGELFALKNALKEYAEKSPVGRDVNDYLGDVR